MLSTEIRFINRKHAGQLLADKLKQHFAHQKSIVFALPRGGIPVAKEVSAALDCPLDIVLVRKLGTPRNPELAMGAIASFGSEIVEIWNDEIADMVSNDAKLKVKQQQIEELNRRNMMYRGNAPPVNLEAYDNIIIVDDGVATGATAKAAILACKRLLATMHLEGRKKIVIAAPVIAKHTADELKSVTSQVITCCCTEVMFAIGQFYQDFTQTSDEEVVEVLKSQQKH